MRQLMFGAAALAFWPVVAQADMLDYFDISTTEELAQLCGAPESDPFYVEAKQFCFGFLSGASHFHRALVDGGSYQPISCPDDVVTRETLAGAFVTWVAANPIHKDEPPVEGLARAMVAEWPCDASAK